jgi:GT2 family glycosyltransferase
MNPHEVATATVVVLSYDRPHLLEKALRSIALQTFRNLEVLVVDNRSASSEQVRKVVSAFPAVRLIANERNLGFTGGMNQGLAEATGKYVYLTEDDLELDADCIALLVDHLERHPNVGIAGPVMWNRHSPTIRCAGGQFRMGSVFQMSVTAAGARALPGSDPFETMFLPGAMVAGRTALLRELGGFHPDFFMYREDVELCARVLERGFRIAIVPRARVYHHEPPDAPDSSLLSFHKHKNLAALYFLHAPFGVLPAFLFRYVVVDGWRRAFASRAMLTPWLKAWGWAVSRSPRLLMQRFRRPWATS